MASTEVQIMIVNLKANLELKISNPRTLLIENIRQTCIFKLHQCDARLVDYKYNSLKFWDYIIKFSEICTNPENPLFTEQCSNMVIESLLLDKEKIDKCIKEEITNGKIIVIQLMGQLPKTVKRLELRRLIRFQKYL
jgi:hypothetical protein